MAASDTPVKGAFVLPKVKKEGFVPRTPGTRIIFEDQLLPLPPDGIYFPTKEQEEHFKHLLSVNFVERILV